mgnify:FL=1
MKKTIGDRLDELSTRGDFRQLSEAAMQDELQRSESSRISTNHPIWELRSVLIEYYGSAFVSQYGEEPNHTWVHMLKDLTQEGYQRGAEALRDRGGAFPPNPGEFLVLAGSKGEWERRCHQAFDIGIEDKSGKERRLAEGLKNIRAIREIMEEAS